MSPLARRNPEKALYRVTPVNGPSAEVEFEDVRDLRTAIYKGLIVPARYAGSSGSFDWLLNAAHIVFAIKEEARSVSQNDESTTSAG